MYAELFGTGVRVAVGGTTVIEVFVTFTTAVGVEITIGVSKIVDAAWVGASTSEVVSGAGSVSIGTATESVAVGASKTSIVSAGVSVA